jgi:rare lipoprotein A
MSVALIGLALLATDADAKRVKASWYKMGRWTASGERFKPDGYTAAHRSLPFGTKLKVTYHNRSVTVRVNDRGPFIRGRQLDLSRGAARAIGCHGVCTLDMVVMK